MSWRFKRVAGYPRLPLEIKAVIDQAFTSILEDTQTITAALGDAQQRATALLDEISKR